MNKIISKFILQQQVATVCIVDHENNPYCFNCFYSFDEDNQLLIFKSGTDNYHASFLLAEAKVAGTILPSKLNLLAVKGLQFEGEMLADSDPLISDAKKIYYKAHPLSIAMSGHIWAIKIIHLKMTDNTKGFGKKFNWQRHSELQSQ